MRVLLFSFWSIHEGISQGTLIQLVNIMENNEKIEAIYLCTVEDKNFTESPNQFRKAVHIPLQVSVAKWIDKILNLIRLPLLLAKLIKIHRIDLLWCKGAPAGGIGSLVQLHGFVPFVVDSFEPHSRYMLESGTWSRLDPKLFLQRWLEKRTIESAAALLPVSARFRSVLVDKMVAKERLFVLPCCVDLGRFSYNDADRRQVRNQLSISDNSIVGIYVGKYGGLYYDDESFGLYKRLFDFFSLDFFLIIVTETDPKTIMLNLRKHEIPVEKVYVSRLTHQEVPAFLSAADFAISTIKTSPAMAYCSPIKHGEYWASNLPILTTLSVGDDAEIITRERGGVILSINDPHPDKKIGELAACIQGRGAGVYSKLAQKHRHPDLVKKAVEFVLKRSVTITEKGD